MHRFDLDPIGQFYASVNSRAHPGSFMIAVYINEAVDARVLGCAVDDLVRRLPYLSGRLRAGFFGYGHELLAAPPRIVPVGEEYTFTDYYNRGAGHVFRVLYGERHFVLETVHTIMDGRGLTRVAQTLVGRYFELLGVKFDKRGMLDCADAFDPAEWEDAYVRFYAPAQRGTDRWGDAPDEAFIYANPRPTAPRVLIKQYDLPALKAAAKPFTLSEYLLAHIFLATAATRGTEKKPVTAMLPIDGRAFFPTHTLRNFVDSMTIIMPETQDLHEILAGLRTQFSRINKEYVQANLNGFQSLKTRMRYVPRVVKKFLLRRWENSGADLTTTFSNVGKLALPAEIEARVSHVAFIIDADAEWMPLTYGAAAAGEVLTLAFTSCMEGDGIICDIDARLRG